MSADWGNSGDYWGNTPTYDQPTYDQPTYSNTGYDNSGYDNSGYDTGSGGPVAPTQSTSSQVYPDGQGGYTDINGSQVDSTGQPITYGTNGDQYDSNGNIINKANPYAMTGNDQTVSPGGTDQNGNPTDAQGSPQGSPQGPQNPTSGNPNQQGPMGPPNPYLNGQSPNYNYPGGQNNPNGAGGGGGGAGGGGGGSGGGLLSSIFGGGSGGGSGGGGLFGGSTGSDLLTLLGVGGAMAFLPKLLNSASGGSSGTTVQAPDYSAQWKNMPALPNYSPNLAKAGTNPGMAMSSNPFGQVGQAGGIAPTLKTNSPVAPTTLFPGAQ